MKSPRLLVGLLVALIVTACLHLVGAAEGKGTNISAVKIEDLSVSGGVIGKLAIPLGKVVVVEGEIVDGTKLRAKSLEGVSLLQVSTVNGQKLPEPCLLRFAWFATTETKKLKGRVNLIGYESGQFVGLPADAFAHIDPVASEGFHFESSFVVLKSR